MTANGLSQSPPRAPAPLPGAGGKRIPIWAKVLVAVGILFLLGILALVGGVFLFTAHRTAGASATAAMITATKAKIVQVVGGLRVYQVNSGDLPTTQQGLRALVERPSASPQARLWTPLCKEKDLLDAWKQPFHYACPGRAGNEPFEVWSDGPDGKANTDDDISSTSVL